MTISGNELRIWDWSECPIGLIGVYWRFDDLDGEDGLDMMTAMERSCHSLPLSLLWLLHFFWQYIPRGMLPLCGPVL